MAYWSELPIELLELIGHGVENLSDARRFRSVCSSWRTAVPSHESHQPPTHIPPVKCLSPQDQDQHSDLSLVKQTMFCLSHISKPNTSWLVKTEDYYKPGVLRLCSPFSRKPSNNQMVNNALDITLINTSEIGHEYVLRNISGDTSLYNMEDEKVAVSYVGNDVDNYALLATHSSTGKLLIYRSYVQEWTLLDDVALGYDDGSVFAYGPLRYVDVTAYKGRFYAVTDSGRTVVIDVGEDSSVVVTLLVKSMIGGDKKCLVKSSDNLLLVDMYTCSVPGSFEVNAIDVYKLDSGEQKWVLLNSLGDSSIFLSNSSSFSTSGLEGLKGNCIFFHFKNSEKDSSKGKDENNANGNEDCDSENGLKLDEIGVFDYGKGAFGSLKDYLEDEFFLGHPPTWITSFR